MGLRGRCQEEGQLAETPRLHGSSWAVSRWGRVGRGQGQLPAPGVRLWRQVEEGAHTRSRREWGGQGGVWGRVGQAFRLGGQRGQAV